MLMNADADSVHELFDLESARCLYDPLGIELSGEHITSPFDLYSIETLRDRHQLRVGSPVPTDIFVWAKGEPSKRYVTKIGGLPYWSASEGWPTSDSGKPLEFIAQFNFLDSRDLVPELPGDVLLLFSTDGGKRKSNAGVILCRWMKVGDFELVTSNPAVSKSRFGQFAGYGVRFRTADYPDSRDATYEVVDRAPYLIPSLHGTKIGGEPGSVQGEAYRSGTFLCQLGSVQACPEREWPWVNSASPLELSFDAAGIYGAENELMIGDLGSLYVFYLDGEIRIRSECY